MASHANLPRPPFIGTSWQVADFVIIWISINYTDYYLSRGSKIWASLDYGFRCCLWAVGQAGSRVVGQQGCAREDQALPLRGPLPLVEGTEKVIRLECLRELSI